MLSNTFISTNSLIFVCYKSYLNIHQGCILSPTTWLAYVSLMLSFIITTRYYIITLASLNAVRVVWAPRLWGLTSHPTRSSFWHTGHFFFRTKTIGLRVSLPQLTSLPHHLSENLREFSDQHHILQDHLFGCCRTPKLKIDPSCFFYLAFRSGMKG